MRELESFFEKQINEHQLVVEKTRELLMDSFLNTVKICSDSLRNNKKILFFVIIIVAIELSGHGILASLFRLLNSAN